MGSSGKTIAEQQNKKRLAVRTDAVNRAHRVSVLAIPLAILLLSLWSPLLTEMFAPVEIQCAHFEHQLRPTGEGRSVVVQVERMVPHARVAILKGGSRREHTTGMQREGKAEQEASARADAETAGCGPRCTLAIRLTSG
jgi:hypothetical protein